MRLAYLIFRMTIGNCSCFCSINIKFFFISLITALFTDKCRRICSCILQFLFFYHQVMITLDLSVAAAFPICRFELFVGIQSLPVFELASGQCCGHLPSPQEVVHQGFSFPCNQLGGFLLQLGFTQRVAGILLLPLLRSSAQVWGLPYLAKGSSSQVSPPQFTPVQQLI